MPGIVFYLRLVSAVRLKYRSHDARNSVLLTFGVSCPTNIGATMPGIVPTVFVTPNNGPANLHGNRKQC